MSIRVLIIDDEELARSSLEILLNSMAADVEIVGHADSVHSGVLAINRFHPNLIFLDVEMSDGSGFEMLDSMDHINFEVIFVTAHEELAIKAFKYEAVNYLLKPVDPEELMASLQRIRNRTTAVQKEENRLHLVKTLSLMNSKVPLPYQDGVRFIEAGKVIRLEADGSYTTIYAENERPHVVTKPLKFYDSILSDALFLRVHRSHIVNIRYVNEFKRDGKCYVILTNGEVIQVSDRRREDVLRRLSE